MYKEIFRWVIAIISQPAKAWVLLAKKGEKQEEFLSRFVYPLIGFVTVAAFLGVLFTRKEFDLELALKSSIRTLVSSFGGFYLGAYLMNEIWQGIFKREKDLKLWLRFVVDVCSIPKRWVVRSLEDSPDKSVAVVHFVVVQWVFTGENESLSSCRIRT